MAVGDTYQLAVRGSVSGQAIVNIHHFRAEAGGDLAATIANGWISTCKTAYLALHATGYTMNTVSCRQINPVGPAGTDVTPGAPVAGTNSGTLLDLVSCGVITWRSSYIGRSRRGRSYVGPPIQGNVVAGALDTNYKSRMGTYANTLLAAYGQGGSHEADARLVIWSPTIARQFSQATPPAMGSASSASAYVTSALVRDVARVQRRRELGVGS